MCIKVLGLPTSARIALFKLSLLSSIMSAFQQNVPVICILIPIVESWATKINIKKRQLLIPLSYASILGGSCTIIGSSINLIASEQA